ncbi:hypothetical protein N7468_005177 [Penicillium chermesinum]|uniref:Uncharacterized protein n=1 Tax=Penicillium chermesinum TaxID=63820 RepID=A0A9W9TMQ7_9EURO|nr:uncharacterized protein N7468_005177 [Penicillium chermesinum]KAJ5232221.1 hypothetical protein N7468_005177 [Penicillium chermesinum]
MCHYQGILFFECEHVRFKLFEFCPAHRAQLDRINDPSECSEHLIPFDTPSECLPRVVIQDGSILLVTERENLATNVVQWVTDLSQICSTCSEFLTRQVRFL